MDTIFDNIPLPNEFFITHMALSESMDSLHFHNCMEISLITSGETTYEFESREFRMREGDIVIINNTEPHRVKEMSHNAGQILLIFNSSFADMGLNDAEYLHPFLYRTKDFENVIRSDTGAAKEISKMLSEMLGEALNKKDGYKMMIRAQLLMLLTALYRECRSKNVISKARLNLMSISSALEYIEKNYQSRIKLKDAAALCGYTPQYFSGLFSSALNTTFIKYLTNTRLKQSKRLLLNTDCPINEVCELSGFENMSNFIARFKDRYGKTPSLFRKERV